MWIMGTQLGVRFGITSFLSPLFRLPSWDLPDILFSLDFKIFNSTRATRKQVPNNWSVGVWLASPWYSAEGRLQCSIQPLIENCECCSLPAVFPLISSAQTCLSASAGLFSHQSVYSYSTKLPGVFDMWWPFYHWESTWTVGRSWLLSILTASLILRAFSEDLWGCSR